MVDTKKLISGFLILASILGSVAFVFSGATLRQTSQKPMAEASNSQNYLIEPVATALTNAFVKKMPGDTSGQLVASIYAPLIIKDDASLSEPTSNLTEALSRYVAKKLIAANPDGPTQDSDGQMNIASPPIDDITAAMAEIPEIKNFKIPDWDAEVEATKLAIVDNPSKSDEEKYVESLGVLFNKYYLQSNLTSVFYKDPATTPPNELLSAATSLENAAKETKSATVPAPLADFHKALLTAVVYEKNAVALGANAGEDPVKASLVMRAQQKNIAAVMFNFQNQFQKSGLQQILSSRPETKAGVTAFLNNLVGVKTAYAFYPVFSWDVFVKMIDEHIKWIWDQIEKILVQVLKNMIIMNLQKQVLDWARGGFHGKPAFITNWKGFFQDIANQTAGAIIQGVAPEVCGPWRTLVTARFKLYYGGTSPFITSCSLSRVISNIEGFYNGFENGGWLAFGAGTLPGNDYFGSIWIMGNEISSANAASKKAASDKAVAGQGYKTAVVCPLGWTDSGQGDCVKPHVSEGTTDCAALTTEATCNAQSDCGWAGACYGFAAGATTAFDDVQEGRAVTPGDTVGNVITDTGQGSSVKLVVNAQNIIGLIATIVQSLITRVMQSGF